MSWVKRTSSGSITALAAALVLAGASFNAAEARYEVIFKLPNSFADKTQQHQYYNRLLKEYQGYAKSSSADVRAWRAFLTTIEDQPQEAQMKAFYKETFSLVKYQSERGDVWSTPGETIARGYGDCDDYAHVYIVSAYFGGFDIEKIWMVAGQVSAGGSKPVGHAVAVMEIDDGRQFVLDNLYGRVVPDSEHKRFKPVYSINAGQQMFYALVNTALAEAF
ncbi:transglutaminase-like domain-containing protein [Pelagibius sp. 7325]|uniref:transglutaminase-like domain-containing protein n=1 Tax=Pelagibius sp. 7325 TaxID=3131994 RepID=UPI0030EE0ED1